MSQYVSLILLAFAVSIDGFSVGFTYGMRKIRIPFISIFTIACCSALVMMISMAVGKSIATFLSPEFAEKIGGLVLILIGAWVLFQFFRPTFETNEVVTEEKILVKVEIKSLGLVINILKKPMVADFDKSGTITGLEALMLGLALSLDAFGAGIGAALLGFSPWVMAIIVALMSSLFLFIGMKSGTFLSKMKWIQKFSFLPGILLILIGIWKF